MCSGPCQSSLLPALPDDVLLIITRSLSPKDICNLSLCCRSLNSLAASEKIWFTQCDVINFISTRDVVEWRKGVSSYKALCKFLVGVQPLIGIWVHQNPELGNVVYVMPGFVSVVGCRIIPQELGPLGLEDGPILWAPVFEIISDFDGAPTFFLHGRERENDYFYPGSVKPIEKTCNILLLEVEPRQQKHGGKLIHSKSFANHLDKEMMKRISRSNSGISRSEIVVSFNRLAFGDRRNLLEIVTSQVGFKLPDSANGPLFPCLRDDVDDENFKRDVELLIERRSLLMQLHKPGGGCIDWHEASDHTQVELREIKKYLDLSSRFRDSQSLKRKSLSGYLRDSFKHLIGKSSVKNGSSFTDYKHAQLHEFMKSSDTIGLSLHASTVKLSSYRAWPNMHDNRFALYKLPMRVPVAGEEYAGLWGGTFGWPPGKPSEDKPGKALFLLLLSYEESEGQQLLIATKILEGTHYVLHPNGSAMFIANINELSLEQFPWDCDVEVKYAFMGEGIANGYGFRYPGSKPGSLFVIQNGLLAFIWTESRAVLTLRRVNLEELLKKGERVSALPPIANFSYLTKSYSNVFAGFANTAALSSPRFANRAFFVIHCSVLPFYILIEENK